MLFVLVITVIMFFIIYSFTIVGMGKSLQVDFHGLSFGRKGNPLVISTPWTNGMQAQILHMDEDYNRYN